MQPGLFDKYPSRPGFAAGCDTSEAAADSLSDEALDTRRRQCLDFIEEKGEHGATCDEIVATLGLLPQSASARLRELVLFNRIKDSGRRRLTRTQRKARVYVIV